MMAQPMSDELARVRAEFERWRSEAAGRGRIPDRLWRAAISLLGTHAPSTVCRELRLSATDLKKRRQALAAGSTASRIAAPAFVELRAVDLGGSATRLARDPGPHELPVRLNLTRPDGARLALEIPSGQWARVEALYAAFLAG
jgi:hypothetical protein